MLALEDLKDFSMKEILSHLTEKYADSEQDAAKLNGLKVLIAYESVGNWGCDSNSFFLLENEQGDLFEIHGSHDSCRGFEGQLQLEETSVKSLLFRLNNGNGVYFSGGYDYNTEFNDKAIEDYIRQM